MTQEEFQQRELGSIVEVTVRIECDKCGSEYDEGFISRTAAGLWFHNLGWRIVKRPEGVSTYCPDCAKDFPEYPEATELDMAANKTGEPVNDQEGTT